jgi:nicotinamidase-related amidase
MVHKGTLILLPFWHHYSLNKEHLSNAFWHVFCTGDGMKARKYSSTTPFRLTASDAGAWNAWSVHEGRTSLVRNAPKPRPLHLDANGHSIEFDLARSALVVVDMQNDFCHPLGWFGQKGIPVKPARKPISVLQRLLPVWRSIGRPVIWLNWGVRPDRLNLPPVVQFSGKRRPELVGYAETSPIDRGPSLVPGHWGAQVIEELTVESSDITVYKHRLSGFWDNELDSVLRSLQVHTLFYAGVNTDRCVFSTLQDAGFLGYDNILLADACSTSSPAYITKAIHEIVQRLHGFVASSGALLDAVGLKQPQSISTSQAHRSSRSTSPSTTRKGK